MITIAPAQDDADYGAALARVAEEIDKLLAAGKVARVDVTEREKPRSNAQNRYMWALFGQIAERTGATSGDVHDYMLDACYGVHYTTINGRRVQKRPKTHSFTQRQAAKFIDWCLMHSATELGVTVMMPDNYERWAAEYL